MRAGYFKLTTLGDIRRVMAQLINERRNDQVNSEKYRDLFYGLKCLRETLEASFLEGEIMERLARLEGNTYVRPRSSELDSDDSDELNFN